jgi:hypothetical protein
LRPGLTYANVMSTIALFIALAGSASATGIISGKDIAPGTATQRGQHLRPSEPRALSAAAVSLYPDSRTGERVTGVGVKTATATCGPGQVVIAGSVNRGGGFRGAPTVAVDYATRRATVTADMTLINNKPDSFIQAVAHCIGAS